MKGNLVGLIRPAERSGEESGFGLWRAVLVALESNGKTARLILILLTLAAVAAVVRSG